MTSYECKRGRSNRPYDFKESIDYYPTKGFSTSVHYTNDYSSGGEPIANGASLPEIDP